MSGHQKSKRTSIDAIDEEIVAYLDCEMDAEEAKKVEQRLAKNAKYRRRVQQMEKAWECLDLLPETKVDDTFTHSTVELVAVAAEEEVRQAEACAQRQTRSTWLLGAAIVSSAAAAGFVLTGFLRPAVNDRLLHDFPVIENVDHYLHADSIDFLRRLDEEGIFNEETAEHAG